MASYAGEDRDPAWARNLRAHPGDRDGRGTSVPRRRGALEGAERRAMFARFVEADGAYGEYPERTSREIPVFELRPEDS